MNTIEQALAQCGVTEKALSTREREALERDGYLVLPAILDERALSVLRAALEAAFAQSRDTSPLPASGTRHVPDLAHRHSAFDVAYTNPRVIAAVHHVLGRSFRVFQLAGRDPLRGYGQQGLHADWLPRAPSQPFSIVTAIWLLDEFTPNNGATRLVPGSHVMPGPLPKTMVAPSHRHPEQKTIVAAAGSVLVINGHLWHSATRNETDLPRRVLQCQFAARELFRSAPMLHDDPECLTPAARYILDV